MPRTAVARRYARALFALARDESRIEAIRAELDALAALFEQSPELQHALFRPLHPGAERRAALRRVSERLGTSASVNNFCSFLIDQRRIVDFPAIREEYGRLADEAAGRTQAEVVAATPLGEEQQERLRRALTAHTGREVEISVRVDEGLLGGVVAKVGDLVFDGSLRTQLEQLRSNLMKGQ